MIVYSFPPLYSGAGTQVLHLAQQLQGKNMAVCVLTGHHDPNLPAQDSLEDILVNRLPVFGQGYFRSLSFFLSVTWHLLWHYRRYDIIHLHDAYLRILPVLLVAKLTRRKTLVKMTQYGADDPQTICQRPFGRVLYRRLALADIVISISRELSESYQNSGLPLDKLVQLPNGVDTNLFHPVDDLQRCKIRSQLGLPQDALLVVFVGRVGYRKGADTLLQAWLKVNENCPQAWLVLVGPVGENGATPTGQARIEHWLSGAPQMLSLGYQTNIQDYLGAADIFTLPTRREGLPNALLEAMATGLPCLASNIGGNVELIVHGENGLLFEVGDVKQLADSLLRLLRNKTERREFSRRAREMVKENYSLNSVATKYIELYHRLLERHQ